MPVRLLPGMKVFRPPQCEQPLAIEMPDALERQQAMFFHWLPART